MLAISSRCSGWAGTTRYGVRFDSRSATFLLRRARPRVDGPQCPIGRNRGRSRGHRDGEREGAGNGGRRKGLARAEEPRWQDGERALPQRGRLGGGPEAARLVGGRGSREREALEDDFAAAGV